MYNAKNYNKEKQMAANKRWREKHAEEYKEYNRKLSKTYRERHRDLANQRALNYYYKHREEILEKLKEKRSKKI